MSYFSNRMKLLRKEAGLSQKQFADIIFVSQQCVSDWENERRGLPSYDMLKRISRQFGCTLESLVGEDDVPPCECNQEGDTDDKHSVCTTFDSLGVTDAESAVAWTKVFVSGYADIGTAVDRAIAASLLNAYIVAALHGAFGDDGQSLSGLTDFMRSMEFASEDADRLHSHIERIINECRHSLESQTQAQTFLVAAKMLRNVGGYSHDSVHAVVRAIQVALDGLLMEHALIVAEKNLLSAEDEHLVTENPCYYAKGDSTMNKSISKTTNKEQLETARVRDVPVLSTTNDGHTIIIAIRETDFAVQNVMNEIRKAVARDDSLVIQCAGKPFEAEFWKAVNNGMFNSRAFDVLSNTQHNVVERLNRFDAHDKQMIAKASSLSSELIQEVIVPSDEPMFEVTKALLTALFLYNTETVPAGDRSAEQISKLLSFNDDELSQMFGSTSSEYAKKTLGTYLRFQENSRAKARAISVSVLSSVTDINGEADKANTGESFIRVIKHDDNSSDEKTDDSVAIRNQIAGIIDDYYDREGKPAKHTTTIVLADISRITKLAGDLLDKMLELTNAGVRFVVLANSVFELSLVFGNAWQQFLGAFQLVICSEEADRKTRIFFKGNIAQSLGVTRGTFPESRLEGTGEISKHFSMESSNNLMTKPSTGFLLGKSPDTGDVVSLNVTNHQDGKQSSGSVYVLAPSGSGKTYATILPNIINSIDHGVSIVATDEHHPALYDLTAQYARDRGYTVKVFDPCIIAKEYRLYDIENPTIMQEIIAASDIDFSQIGTEKYLVFAVGPYNVGTFNPIITSFYESIINALTSPSRTDGDKPVRHVNFFLENLGLIGEIEDLASKLTLGRDYDFSFLITHHTLGQLMGHYPDNWERILQNFDALLCLRFVDMTTASYFATTNGVSPFFVKDTNNALNVSDLITLPENEALVFTRALAPFKVKKLLPREDILKTTAR